eukprot:TRINITY_DN41767_c0_g1_i1.p1 TRINITY_DN41767_c0_g1~~TRINITY_DN41767_c0_g1_i1.p1  ORF type:complete len:372 (-),score=67.01 TRINITY_DN41767_c0_g1_i1:23-1075(-)
MVAESTDDGSAARKETLQKRVSDVEALVLAQDINQRAELTKLNGEVAELRALAEKLEREKSFCKPSVSEVFIRRVEWTITGISEKLATMQRSQSVWSPHFDAGGMNGLQLEFLPLGGGKTTYEGFCSLFLWCPGGMRVKYQLFVGSFIRAPDEDTYPENIGHGHSNFCPVLPEIDEYSDSVIVGAVFYEVSPLPTTVGSLTVIPRPIEAMIAREVEVLQNKNVNRVCWKVRGISKYLAQLPKGASLYSPLFTVAGIRELLLDFLPNGSTQTTKDGFCSLYVRCTPGVSMVITLFVGSVRKGPIKTTFTGLSGKGLPDFCLLRPQVNEDDDSVEVGLEVQNEQISTVFLES